MHFLYPIWLTLIPAAAAAAWAWPGLGLRHGWRFLAIVLIVIALARPQIERGGAGVDLYVFFDRSASAEHLIDSHLREWEESLKKGKKDEDRLFLMDFAGTSARRNPGVVTVLEKGQSRLAFALSQTLTDIDSQRPSRFLVVTDGHATESLGGLGERLGAQGVPLDYRLVSLALGSNARAEALRTPARVRKGESFPLEIVASSSNDGVIPFIVERDGQQVMEGSVSIRGGKGRLRLQDRLEEPGMHRYLVRLRAPGDELPGDDTAEAWVELSGGSLALVLSGHRPSPVAESLRRGGFTVKEPESFSKLAGNDLGGVKLVVLDDLPAHLLPQGFLQSLDFYVRAQGGGLIMSGGQFSFGSGGYYGSPIDPLLPISLDLKEDQRRQDAALCVVVDRSGSMSCPTPSGKQKIELAGEAAARAVELLSPRDRFSLIVVDSGPHDIVGMRPIGSDRAAVAAQARSIKSSGGGIYIGEALRAAKQEIAKAAGMRRHVILFADAADSEEPGDWEDSVAAITGSGATITVIGMGSDSDVDAGLLKAIASRAKGRLFFCQDMDKLPQIFAMETVAVARSAFIEKAVKTQATGRWSEIGSRDLEWPPQVDGYNLCATRPEAILALHATDKERSPLLALARRGAGRCGAVCFPLSGEFAKSVHAWKGYDGMLQTLARWCQAPPAPQGVGLRSHIDGNTLTLELHNEGSRDAALALKPPSLVVATPQGEIEELSWQRLRPGQHSATLQLSPGQPLKGAVQVLDGAIPFGPVFAGIDPEWDFSPSGPAALRALSQSTGGEERTDFSQAFVRPPRRDVRDFTAPVLALGLITFLLALLIERTGWKLLPDLRRIRPAQAAPEIAVAAPEPPKPQPRPETEVQVESSDELKRRQRFERARRK
ncbi:MAG: hypothetical protein RL095_1435 [Verrucomicrobiota bacterium]|jgi:Mg-chelatase subunit ChlD